MIPAHGVDEGVSKQCRAIGNLIFVALERKDSMSSGKMREIASLREERNPLVYVYDAKVEGCLTQPTQSPSSLVRV